MNARRATEAGCSMAALLAAAMLSGCAGLRAVPVEVRAFGNWPAGQAPATFAFERLPSQQANAERQGEIEAAAALALQAAGFKPADAATAQVLVEVHAGARQSGSLVDDHWGPAGRFGFYGPWPYGFGMVYQAPIIEYQADLLMRGRTDHAVVYEGHARHERVGSALPSIKPLFDAALKFFPQSSNGAQTVSVSFEPTSP